MDNFAELRFSWPIQQEHGDGRNVSVIALKFGGRDGIRTHDLLIANEEKSKLRLGATVT
jgi:hypothetical protein